MKVPKFKVIDRRRDEEVTAQVSSIDFMANIVCYVNEYNEEEVVDFNDEDCELIEDKENGNQATP